MSGFQLLWSSEPTLELEPASLTHFWEQLVCHRGCCEVGRGPGRLGTAHLLLWESEGLAEQHRCKMLNTIICACVSRDFFFFLLSDLCLQGRWTEVLLDWRIKILLLTYHQSMLTL